MTKSNKNSEQMSVFELFERQKELQEAMFNKHIPFDSVEDFKHSSIALVAEIGEVLAADTRWKDVRNTKYDREEKLNELVDCMCFLINAILYSGFTVNEFAEAYIKKNDYNFNRK